MSLLQRSMWNMNKIMNEKRVLAIPLVMEGSRIYSNFQEYARIFQNMLEFCHGFQ